MPQDGTERRVRSGAKSCAECRRRKIRCIYSANKTGASSTGRQPCDNCLNHGRDCLPQLQRSEASKDGRMTARERIGRLERNMNSLVELLNEKHAAAPRDRNSPEEDQISAVSNEIDAGFDISETEHATLPSHLRLLFDNFIDDSSMAEALARDSARSAQVLEACKRNARAKLLPLLPSREEVSSISPYASDWMNLYYTLFPPSFAFQTTGQLVANYDGMHDGKVSPVTLAMYLLSLAITAQQVPAHSLPLSFSASQSVSRYIDAVCRTVEQAIIHNNALASTADALETAMLYVRLSMGRTNLKSTWLVHRRIIALAEVIGLPLASENAAHISQTGVGPEDLKQRANVWEAICATDRNFSLMFSFPAATARYRFPQNDLIMQDGIVSPNLYNYQLSNICAAISEIDDSYLRRASDAESYEKVLSADRQLRALGASAPKSWWQDSEDEPLANLLVKFWHHYFLARIHLRPGLMSDFDEQYPYSRSTCQDACREAVRRFCSFRGRVPTGFFVCRVLDVQVFTAATFLLLSSRSQKPDGQLDHSQDSAATKKRALVGQAIDCLTAVRDEPGADMAREAEVALSSLVAFASGHTSNVQPLRLQIPLLGRVQINRADPSTADGQNSTEFETNASAPMEISNGYANGASEFDSAFDPILWSFEFSDPSTWMGSIDQLDMSGMDDWLSDGRGVGLDM